MTCDHKGQYDTTLPVHTESQNGYRENLRAVPQKSENEKQIIPCNNTAPLPGDLSLVLWLVPTATLTHIIEGHFIVKIYFRNPMIV